MIIKGLQKTTLLDYPTKVACTVFTAGCNFRCPFCHNASLVTRPDDTSVDMEVFFNFLNKRKGILDGVCITGGEPLMQKNIVEFIERIKSLGYSVKLDTNGSFPKILAELIDRGLVDYVAMDIKGPQSKYSAICGIEEGKHLDSVKESIFLLIEKNKLGLFDFEFRTTVVRELHQKEDFEEIGRLIEGAPKYFLQQFKDSGELIDTENIYTAYSKEEMLEFLDTVKKYVPTAALRGID